VLCGGQSSGFLFNESRRWQDGAASRQAAPGRIYSIRVLTWFLVVDIEAVFIGLFGGVLKSGKNSTPRGSILRAVLNAVHLAPEPFALCLSKGSPSTSSGRTARSGTPKLNSIGAVLGVVLQNRFVVLAAIKHADDGNLLGVQYCSFKKNSVRPEPVEGLLVSSWWFDKALPSLSKGSPRTVNRTALGSAPMLFPGKCSRSQAVMNISISLDGILFNAP